MKKLVALFLCVTSFNIYAINPTQGPLQQDPSLCAYGYNPNCAQSGNPSSPRKIIRHIEVNVPSKYGALAANKKTGGFGGAIEMNSKAEAKREAIKRCENGGKNAPCKIVTLVKNGCIAAATNSKNVLFTVAEEQGHAENAVMNNCRAAGASGCKIVLPEACSLPDTSQY